MEPRLNDDQREEFKELSNKIIKFLNDNFHPHIKVIIGTNSAEIVEGVLGHQTDEFIKD